MGNCSRLYRGVDWVSPRDPRELLRGALSEARLRPTSSSGLGAALLTL
jgi:hypothetical protein